MISLAVPASGYERLLDYIVDTFARSPEGGLIPLGTGLYGESRFYGAQGSFHALNTCNTWVARGGVSFRVSRCPNTAVVSVDDLLTRLGSAVDAPCYRRR